MERVKEAVGVTGTPVVSLSISQYQIMPGSADHPVARAAVKQSLEVSWLTARCLCSPQLQLIYDFVNFYQEMKYPANFTETAQREN